MIHRLLHNSVVELVVYKLNNVVLSIALHFRPSLFNRKVLNFSAIYLQERLCLVTIHFYNLHLTLL